MQNVACILQLAALIVVARRCGGTDGSHALGCIAVPTGRGVRHFVLLKSSYLVARPLPVFCAAQRYLEIWGRHRKNGFDLTIPVRFHLREDFSS